jgi:peptidoglycan/LPS O-acetylase OafA/YrhL
MDSTLSSDSKHAVHLSRRPEIDGLRALAVVPVIMFHAGLPLFAGGFIGVDIFFVISGYLITRIILSELEVGAFSTLKFYERRARRILPALFCVIIFTVPFAVFWMPPAPLEEYFQSIYSTALFISNIHFWESIDYFNPSAEEQPLLHTWSLAVEEQFYVFFPLLLIMLHRFLKNSILAIIMGLLPIGFVLCLYTSHKSEVAAFYLIHARAWELAAGAMVAAVELRHGQSLGIGLKLRNLLSISGLLAILVSVVFINQDFRYPGWATLFPVFGTALIIATARQDTLAGSLLSLRPFLAIGLISYSAYLWHHPLFAFARLTSVNQPSAPLMLTLVALSFAFAYLSWRFVELPFRQPGLVSKRTLVLSATAMTAAFVVAGIIGPKMGLMFRHFNATQTALIDPPLSKVKSCKWRRPLLADQSIEFCDFGTDSGDAPVLLWGDSHAQALFDAMNLELKKRGLRGAYIDADKCTRLFGIYGSGSSNDGDESLCEKKQLGLLNFLRENPPKAIVISLRWSLRLFPGAEDKVGFDNREGGVEYETGRMQFAKSADGTWTTAGAAKLHAIKNFLASLEKIAPVVIVGPIPEVGWNVGNTNFKSIMIRKENPPDISTSFQRFRERNQFILGALDEMQRGLRFQRVDPEQIFCNTWIKDRCVAQYLGIPYYADDDHVSESGAELIVQQILMHIP